MLTEEDVETIQGAFKQARDARDRVAVLEGTLRAIAEMSDPTHVLGLTMGATLDAIHRRASGVLDRN